MMTLPVFLDPHPTDDWLRSEQQRLRKQADKMITETGILDTYKRYGQLSKIGGSYEYDLMIYPDLDVGLIAKTVSKESFGQLLSEVSVHKYVRKTSSADTVNFKTLQNRPKGYWVGVEVVFEDERWGIDCWLQQPDWAVADDDKYLYDLLALDQTAKDAILRIKYDLIRLGVYGKKIMSSDVYDSVIHDNVRTTNQLLEIINK